MESIFALIFFMALAVFFVAAAKVRASSRAGKSLSSPEAGSSTQEEWPFYATSVMTGAELELYRRLRVALPEHIVLAQVGLSRVLSVRKGYNVAEWNNRINRMSLDFVVCDEFGRVVAAIELDDSSHQRRSRQEADAKKDRALASAGVRLIRWPCGGVPEIPETRSQVLPPQPVPTPVP